MDTAAAGSGLAADVLTPASLLKRSHQPGRKTFTPAWEKRSRAEVQAEGAAAAALWLRLRHAIDCWRLGPPAPGGAPRLGSGCIAACFTKQTQFYATNRMIMRSSQTMHGILE
mmetsp:Transcript_20537/g.61213  ORF Transcript_20537/g.61213 Transcript_20537/m.61213 type:complete len:113 (-) Transcript_20537:67-405(-)